MKKVIIFISLIAGAIIVLFSCSKEPTLNEEPVKNENVELTDYEITVNKSIKDFKQKMAYYRENPHLKSGEEVPADSALWYLESTINHSHSFPGEYYREFKIDSVFMSITKNANGEVDLAELSQKYDELKSEVTSLYYTSGFENKGLAVVDLKESSQSGTDITFIAETVTGNKSNDPPPSPVLGGPFEPDDNWWYGEIAGLCSDNTSDDSDAAQQLFYYINDEIPDPNGNYYFINHIDYEIVGGDPLIRRNDPEDNYRDYLLYYASTGIGPCGDDVLCVEYQEMNHYYSYLNLLIFSYLPDNDPVLYGKSIEEVLNIQGYSVFEDPDIKYKHHLWAIFGEKVSYTEGEGSEEL